MGLRDKIKEKKEIAPEGQAKPPEEPEKEKVTGKKVVAESKEEFLETVEQLKTEFEGVVVLYGEIEGDSCNVSLLIQGGNVIGATFEYLETTLIGNDALSAVQNKLKGSAGGMDLYQFEEGDIEIAIKQNEKAILETPVPLASTGIKIKYLMDAWVQEKKSSGVRTMPIRIPEIKGEKKTFNLFDLAKSKAPEKSRPRTIYDKMDASGGGEGVKLGGIMAGLGASATMEEMEKLKKKKLRDMEVAERLGKIKADKSKEVKKKVMGGKKVKTPIDRLLEIVKKRKTVKLDEMLAKKLGVKRVQIEEWAIILEDHGLVELHYPTIGDPEIRAVEK